MVSRKEFTEVLRDPLRATAEKDIVKIRAFLKEKNIRLSPVVFDKSNTLRGNTLLVGTGKVYIPNDLPVLTIQKLMNEAGNMITNGYLLRDIIPHNSLKVIKKKQKYKDPIEVAFHFFNR